MKKLCFVISPIGDEGIRSIRKRYVDRDRIAKVMLASILRTEGKINGV